MILIDPNSPLYETILLALERADDHSTGDRFRKAYEAMSLDEIAPDELDNEINKDDKY